MSRGKWRQARVTARGVTQTVLVRGIQEETQLLISRSPVAGIYVHALRDVVFQ